MRITKTVLTTLSLLVFGIESSHAIDAEFGDSVKCINNSDGTGVPNRVYRVTRRGEILRPYPNAAVAYSWDDEWHVDARMKYLDCTDLTIVEEVMPSKPDNLHEYDTIVCDPSKPNSGEVGTLYRFTDDGIRPYPTLTIADSWDANWESNVKEIDCTGFDVTDNMPPYPAGVEEGSPVGCIIDTDESGNRPYFTYRFSRGKLRHYPIPAVAYSWDATWEHNIIKFDCTGIKTGPVMTSKPADLNEGEPIKCTGNSDRSDNPNKIYRYADDNKIRWYPNPQVAFSWDSDWPLGMKFIDCSGFEIGLDMTLL